MLRLALPISLLALAMGCVDHSAESPTAGGMSDAEIARLRPQLLLSVKPEGAETVVQVRDALAAADPSQTPDHAAVMGQIGGMPNPYGSDAQPDFPWVAGHAVFFLVDPTTAAQFEGHEHEAGEECSFCMGKARELVDTVAMVKLQFDGHEVTGVRADQLLGLHEGESVIVSGIAHEELGMLVIDAHGVYVEPAAETN